MNNELKTALTKIANQDLAHARKGGVIVTDTKAGNLDVKFDGAVYTIHTTQGVKLVEGKASVAREFLITSYQVQG